MAFFKFRKGADEAAGKPRKSAAAQAESVEAMRRRARHRLIGAAVLVLAGVVGFPLLFDTQPRPIAVDIPIEIPDRAKARPLASAAPVAEPAPAAPAPAPLPQPAAPPAPAVAPVPAPAPPAPAVTVRAEAPAAPLPAAPAAPTPVRDEAARARALLEGGAAAATAAAATPAASADGRFVVQVGAFADATLARDVRARLERAGLKTYTHVAETKDGRRIRVRLGPFATRAEADRAAEKARQLDLPAAVLTL
jgi:DedD protein